METARECCHIASGHRLGVLRLRCGNYDFNSLIKKSITSQVSKEISMVKIHCKSYTVPLVENSDGIKCKSKLFYQNRRFISSCWLFLVAKTKKKKKKRKEKKNYRP